MRYDEADLKENNQNVILEMGEMRILKFICKSWTDPLKSAQIYSIDTNASRSQFSCPISLKNVKDRKHFPHIFQC
jgi:hypothetical protein